MVPIAGQAAPLVARVDDADHLPRVGQCDDAFLDVVAGPFGACGAGGGDGGGRGRRLGRAPASREREEEYRCEQEHGYGERADAGGREWFAFSHFECFLPCLVASVFHARMASLRSSWRVRMRMPWRSQEHAHICRMADVFRLMAWPIRSKLMFRLPQVGHGTGLCHLRGRVSFGWPIVFHSFP